MHAQARTIDTSSGFRRFTTLALVALMLASMLATTINLSSVSAQSEIDSLAAATPAGTVMYFEMNLDQSSDQWVQTFDLIDRAGLNQVAEDTTGATVDDLGESAEQMHFNGSAAMVFTDASALVEYSSADMTASAMDVSDDLSEGDAPEVPEGFALLMMPDDSAAIAQQFEGLAADDAESNDGTVETTEYNGVTITYWAPDDATTPGTATAEINGVVILATRASDIEPIIDTVQGENDNLASEEGYKSITDKLGNENLMFGYLNLDEMITAFTSNEDFIEYYGSMMSQEDIDAASGHAGFSIYASEAGFHFDSVMIPNDPSSLPATSDFTPSMAGVFPADILAFTNGNNIYGTGITEMLGTLMQTAMSESGEEGTTPAATPTMEDTWAMFEQQLGFNPDTDLLQKLDGEWAASVSIPDFDAETFEVTPEFLFISKTSDAATLTSTADTITSLVEQVNTDDAYTVSSREVEGGTLTVVTVDDSATEGIPVVIEYGVVGDELLIGMNGSIDSYLAGDQPTLADDENFQATFAELPSDNVMSVEYVNVEGQVLPLLDVLVTQINSAYTTLDNDEACGDYATQQEAQHAYDADSTNLWNLDMDFDGTACEDYFAESMPVEATPEAISDQVNILGAGSVTWVDDDAMWMSSILLIGD